MSKLEKKGWVCGTQMLRCQKSVGEVHQRREQCMDILHA